MAGQRSGADDLSAVDRIEVADAAEDTAAAAPRANDCVATEEGRAEGTEAREKVVTVPCTNPEADEQAYKTARDTNESTEEKERGKHHGISSRRPPAVHRNLRNTFVEQTSDPCSTVAFRGRKESETSGGSTPGRTRRSAKDRPSRAKSKCDRAMGTSEYGAEDGGEYLANMMMGGAPPKVQVSGPGHAHPAAGGGGEAGGGEGGWPFLPGDDDYVTSFTDDENEELDARMSRYSNTAHGRYEAHSRSKSLMRYNEIERERSRRRQHIVRQKTGSKFSPATFKLSMVNAGVIPLKKGRMKRKEKGFGGGEADYHGKKFLFGSARCVHKMSAEKKELV